jgi:hypothetical protein
MSEESCTTPGPDTDEVLRARYQFRSQPLPSLSLGELSDLLIAHAAGEFSEGALVDITGLDRLTLRAMHLKAITTSEKLWKSWRASEEVRFMTSLESSKPTPTDIESSSPNPGKS